MEFAQVCVERGEAIVLPDPGYPDYRSAVALAAAQHVALPLLPDARPDWDAAPGKAAALYLNYPSNPVAACAPEGVFEEALGNSALVGLPVGAPGTSAATGTGAGAGGMFHIAE